MSLIHGRFQTIEVETKDIPVTQGQLERTVDSHDVTLSGAVGHAFHGGLTNGTYSLTGIYDSATMTGPRAVLEPLLGELCDVVDHPEGDASGAVERTFSGLLIKYTETRPVAEMVTWAADFQVSGTVTVGTIAP